VIKNIHQVPIFHIFIYLFVHFLSKQMENKENNDNPCVNNEGERGKYRALEARLEVKRCIVVLIKITREKKQREILWDYRESIEEMVESLEV